VSRFEIDQDALAFELIRERVEKGNFTGIRHTLFHMKREQWFRALLNRTTWENWMPTGSKDLLAKARDMKNNILKEHISPRPDKQTEKEIDRIVRRARTQLVRETPPLRHGQ